MPPPSLVALCIAALLPYPDSLDVLYPLRLRLAPALLRELVVPPIDPRLWAILRQLFHPLPHHLATAQADLADPRLAVLRNVTSTPSFQLVTVLELPGCTHLTDDVVAKAFRCIHSLTAMDASETPLTAYAIQSLASALDDDDGDKRGPWTLSVLFLRNCKSITNDVYPHLVAFPLLSVVDLSGTLCSLPVGNSPFRASADDTLFHPTSLLAILSSVHNNSANFSTLHITSFSKPKPPTNAARVLASQDSFVVFSPSSSRPQIGNTNTLTFDEESVRAPLPISGRSISSSFYQPLPKLHKCARPSPTNLRLARPPPLNPHLILRAAQSRRIQLRHQNRAFRSNLDPNGLVAAQVNWSSNRAKHARLALQNIVRGRVESPRDKATSNNTHGDPSRVRLTPPSRNPFRRSCSGGNAGERSSTATAFRPSAFTQGPSLDSNSKFQTSTTTSGLKPISSIKPPILPAEPRNPNSASKKRRASLPSLQHQKRSRADVASDSDFENDNDDSQVKTKVTTNLSKQKGGSGPSIAARSQVSRFDWKAWSCGSS